MEPEENPQGADFDWTRGHNAHLPHVVEIHGGDIHEPYRATGRQQTAYALFGAQAYPTFMGGLLFSGPRDLNDRNKLAARLKVALTLVVPNGVIVLVELGHHFQSDTFSMECACYLRSDTF